MVNTPNSCIANAIELHFNKMYTETGGRPQEHYTTSENKHTPCTIIRTHLVNFNGTPTATTHWKKEEGGVHDYKNANETNKKKKTKQTYRFP